MSLNSSSYVTHMNESSHTPESVMSHIQMCHIANRCVMSQVRMSSFTYVNSSCHTCQSQHTATRCNTLQHAATRCNTLQHAATRCNTLQHTATRCNTLQHAATKLQHTATRCNTLHYTATHKNESCRACQIYEQVMLHI